MGAVAGIFSALVGAFGTFAQMSAASKQAKAAKKAEEARRRQMELDAAQRRRQVARKAAIERSKVLANASGAGIDQSSPVAGSLGSIASIGAGEIKSTNQSEQIGNQIFAANMQAIDAREDAAMASGFSSIGQSFFGAIGQLGRYFV